MFNSPDLNGLIQKLCAAVPANLQTIETDLHDTFQSILQAGFSELDLVTREEFDAQVKVLARTREKVEALQAQLDQISKT
jgi:ubiquinone biosynthesis accessory factor UbiK